MVTRRRKRFIFSLMVLCSLFFVYKRSHHDLKTEVKFQDDYYSLIYNRTNSNNYRNKTKFVLIWAPQHGATAINCIEGIGYEPFEHCEYQNCFMTNNQTLLPLHKFDALIFDASYTVYQAKYGTPYIRSSNQIYIYMNMESPRITEWDLKPFGSFFNWTMTYRHDSDVVDLYGYLYRCKTNFSMPSTDLLKNKTGAAWMVSHCHTDSKREILVNELKKLYKVDVYGKCGNLTCSSSKMRSNKCYEMIEEKYKFYLAFENSYCKDYITEKVIKLLMRNVVPVVYSAGINKALIPPRSIIDVTDFKDVRHLADYLQYLDDNVDEYKKYLLWKKDFYVVPGYILKMCKLCKKLHEPLKNSVYTNISSWWYGPDNKTTCVYGQQLPKIVSDLLK